MLRFKMLSCLENTWRSTIPMNSFIFTTGRSFVMLAKELLVENDCRIYILSERLLCQDNIEQYFASQRSRGGTNNSLTASSYSLNERNLSITRDLQIPSTSGNCRGGVLKAVPTKVDNTTLPKKRKKVTLL